MKLLISVVMFSMLSGDFAASSDSSPRKSGLTLDNKYSMLAVVISRLNPRKSADGLHLWMLSAVGNDDEL
ncbi:hypothetical protein CFE70_001304 [Pyrenophora teres f. teres 0-1]